MDQIADLESRAREFATEAHGKLNQVRKYTGEPYINHPAAVVELVRSVPHSPEMLAAAWLHDVVEDCGVSLDEIEDRFGIEVFVLVESLTDVSKPDDGNRAVRKAIDRYHIATACPSAKTIKLADLIDNSVSIMEHDPKFAAVCLAEMTDLLEVLRQGDTTLYARARDIVLSRNEGKGQED